MLEHLLDFKNYLDFIRNIAHGKIFVKERDEWLEYVGKDPRKLEDILVYIAKELYKRHREVVYPYETIIVPRYPFSKQPIVSWYNLKDKDFSNYEVNAIKYASSRLGNLINAGFILKHFVLIDIDTDDPKLRSLVDIKTRRGYHKIFYIGNYEAILIKFRTKSGTTATYKYIFNLGDVKIEVMSGKDFLGSHPLQTRYLDFKDGKIHVKSYKLLSSEASNSFLSADVTLLKASINDIEEFLLDILKIYGQEKLIKNIELKPVEKQELEPKTSKEMLSYVRTAKSRFNQAPISALGSMSYSEFKQELSKFLSSIPYCIKEALFGSPEKGTRWYHLRLLLAIVPYFVYLDEENMSALINDFSSRTKSTRSDVRQWIYSTKYFTGRLGLGDEEIVTPSRFGAPTEVYTLFKSLGYCDKCPIKEECLRAKNKRKVMISHLLSVLGGTQ